MDEVVCLRVGVYQSALTRGKSYTVVAANDARKQIRVKGDNRRTRWFPTFCFDQSGEDVPTLAAYQPDDEITPGEEHTIFVTVTLSNGEQRWCLFATPSQLASCGHWIEGTKIYFHYHNRHLIVANELSEELIGRMLKEIDSQGYLAECTVPSPSSDEDE